MILEIKRYGEYFNTTPGELWLDDVRVAYTIELPWRNNQHDISCIPVGTYGLTINKSKRLGIILPLLIGVPDREGIRLHVANKSSELLGCIAPVRKLYIEERTIFGSTSQVTLDDVMRWIRIHNIKQFKVSQLNDTL